MNSTGLMTPRHILEDCFSRAKASSHPLIADPAAAALVEMIGRNLANRAVARLVLACALAKAVDPQVDIRKPYTEIAGSGTYSGRTFDERYVTEFILQHALPCNPTTAFLTPALRNINRPLTLDIVLEGRPRELYQAAQQLFDWVESDQLEAMTLLTEMIRILLMVRDENRSRMESYLAGLKATRAELPLSVEDIVQIISHHLSAKGASRLPVLVIAAIYDVIERFLGERALDLTAHNAADRQTGAIGDLQIALKDDEGIVTAFEMKLKQVTINDVELALQKIGQAGVRPSNYVFVTTHPITPEVTTYCQSLYDVTGGIEVAVLDCISLLRHFLHLFTRLRGEFIDAYQARLLRESDSAVSGPVKELFLALRQAAQSSE